MNTQSRIGTTLKTLFTAAVLTCVATTANAETRTLTVDIDSAGINQARQQNLSLVVTRIADLANGSSVQTVWATIPAMMLQSSIQIEWDSDSYYAFQADADIASGVVMQASAQLPVSAGDRYDFVGGQFIANAQGSGDASKIALYNSDGGNASLGIAASHKINGSQSAPIAFVAATVLEDIVAAFEPHDIMNVYMSNESPKVGEILSNQTGAFTVVDYSGASSHTVLYNSASHVFEQTQ